MAMSLCHMLIAVHCVASRRRPADEEEMIYHYLTGPEFRLRVRPIVEAIARMSDDLAREKNPQVVKMPGEQIDRVMARPVSVLDRNSVEHCSSR